MVCINCRAAGRACRENPAAAAEFHKECPAVQKNSLTLCDCGHIIPEDSYEYVTSRVDG